MKELSIEEKAKAYDKALEKARQLCVYPTSKPFISDLQDLFPELKESEDDRIRKWLIGYFQRNKIAENIKTHDILAWLEKQGSEENKGNLGGISPNSAWSEEDERNIQVIDSVLFYDKSLSEDTCMRLRNWLESLKQRLREKNYESILLQKSMVIRRWTNIGCRQYQKRSLSYSGIR